MKVTAGFKSTEFWLTVVTVVAMAIWPDMPKESLIAVVGYALSRGMNKWGKAKVVK